MLNVTKIQDICYLFGIKIIDLKMRDTKLLEQHTKKIQYKEKEMELFKQLKKEVQTNGFGTREYVIKKGINKGKIAK